MSCNKLNDEEGNPQYEHSIDRCTLCIQCSQVSVRRYKQLMLVANDLQDAVSNGVYYPLDFGQQIAHR